MTSYPRILQRCALIAACLFMFRHGVVAASQPATNDMFANRIALAGTNVTVQGTTSGAGTEAGEYAGNAAALLLYTVWYSWTAPTSGVLRVSGSTTVPNLFLSIGSYKGNAVNALTAAPTSPDGGVTVQAGDEIIFQIGSLYYLYWGGGGGSGPFTLRLTLEQPSDTSPNDLFANRLPISFPTYHFEGSIYAATNELGEPLPARQTLWWKFIAPESGLLTVLPSTGQFAAMTTLYEGTDLAALVRVNPIAGTTYNLVSGREYAVQLATDYAPAGNFTLDCRFHPSRHDMFATSQKVEGTNVLVYGNILLATSEPGEPLIEGTNTIWFSWAAPATGRATFAPGPRFAIWIAVYTGPAVDRLTPVRLLGQSSVWSFLAEKDRIYHFQYAGMAQETSLSIQLDPLLNASNDDFAEAELVKGSVIYFPPRSVLGATMETGEPAHRGDTPQKSLWWKWQAPSHGTLYLSSSSLVPDDVVLAAYQGPAVESLRLIQKATNVMSMSVVGGEVYYIAAAVPAGAIGDIGLFAQQQSSVSFTPSIPVPGNVLWEPSWEGTGIVGAQYWHRAGSVGGYVNERGGADGSTWPSLSTGAAVWQDFPTVPGRDYEVRFAYLFGRNQSACCGDASVRFLWDGKLLGLAEIPESEPRFWHWAQFVVRASNTTSQVRFENAARNVELDAFSARDLSAPPTVVNQPRSISSVAGGTAAFIVGANGSTPLGYQWFFNDSPLAGQNDRTLLLDPVRSQDAGQYRVIVTNAFGAVTSAPAALVVDAPTNATILLQPRGDTVPPGGYFNTSVAAAGSLPIRYQWFLNGSPLPGATNRNLAVTNVTSADAGRYEVLVENYSAAVWSLPATLTIGEGITGGGTVDFRNRFHSLSLSNEAPIFDIDGVTPLSGEQYVAQLYAGPSLELMRPAGEPSPFRTAFNAGFFVSHIVTLANVAPGEHTFTQVRAWESARGSSYEEARALGGKFGRSDVVELIAGGPLAPPPAMPGLRSFSLQAGLPEFSVGRIEFQEREPGGVIIWSLHGNAGFRYLVEKSTPLESAVWRPFVVLTNHTGVVNFNDSASSSSRVVLYRARILD